MRPEVTMRRGGLLFVPALVLLLTTAGPLGGEADKRKERRYTVARRYYLKGNAYLVMEQYSQAAEMYRKSLEYRSDTTSAYRKLSAVYAKLGRKRDSLRVLETGYVNGLTVLPISWQELYKGYYNDPDFSALYYWCKTFLPVQTYACCTTPSPYPSFIRLYDSLRRRDLEKANKISVAFGGKEDGAVKLKTVIQLRTLLLKGETELKENLDRMRVSLARVIRCERGKRRYIRKLQEYRRRLLKHRRELRDAAARLGRLIKAMRQKTPDGT